MGSSQDIMHQFARQEINRFFSTYDGWKITPQSEAGGYDQQFNAERTISGNREATKVLVSFDKTVPKAKLESMRSSATGPYGQVQKNNILLIVPQNADTSSVPDDVRISLMNSFAFQGNDLTWTKKPVQKTEEEKAKVMVK
ncbi:MAG: hypothetical protein M0Q91_04660 [Methanoregula sp.]|jgi:hypothetical protein|nr:hypothetical protein [Methanoregula sp.]